MVNFKEPKAKHELSFDNRQLLLVFSGMVLILILVFILGALFGRSVANHRLQLSAERSKQALFQEQPKPSNIAPVSITQAEKPSSELTQPALQSSTAEKMPSLSEMLREEQEKKELLKKLEQEKFLPASLDSTKAEKKEEQEKRISSKEQAKASVAEKAEESGSFTIQVASTQDKASAEKLLKALKDKKWDAYISEVNIPEKGIFYRVKVGHYSSKENAQKALKIFLAQEPEYKEAFITR